jgi:hypothetical protein
MTVLEKAPELTEPSLRSDLEAELVVSPSDITFHDLSADKVEIRIKVSNKGQCRSRPTVMRLESAPLGAFVPGRPLAILSVPPLEPGESRALTIEAARPHPKPLGNFDGIPPKSVLTALSAAPDEPPARSGARLAALLKLFRRQGTPQPTGKNTVSESQSLAPDVFELLGREQPHWAGNINVFIGRRAVERHVARALRIYSGRTNLAIFMVGEPGKRDAYGFDVLGLAPDWKAALYDVTAAKTLVTGASDTPFQERQWVEAAAGNMMVVLVVCPPVVCEEGNVQVQVTRRSCQKTAVVEFNLDPTAQGTGCYVA